MRESEEGKKRKKTKGDLIEAITEFVEKREEGFPADLRTKKKDIKESVFKMEGELRISGEVGNAFSDVYVNYYDMADVAAAMQNHLWGLGLEVEWYNPAYMSMGCE